MDPDVATRTASTAPAAIDGQPELRMGRSWPAARRRPRARLLFNIDAGRPQASAQPLADGMSRGQVTARVRPRAWPVMAGPAPVIAPASDGAAAAHAA